ncbi:ATP-dependent DNA ligase [Agreia pratensis]|uniref:ATP-dependent DNA ligase n=1 Tax=Agreia pratensis TaxID=150121 RepID=UPI00188C52CA|nr:ATP-dependent DNA ligase [Agreia pratensis]MBF4634824.1 ATP-dependent DNA ligase [Agreia pratensis]
MSATKQVVSVGGQRLTLTNLDKVLYPETGTTKGEVLDYYASIAPVLIPHARDRPATRKRWVNGVGTAQHPGEMFFQKNLDDGTPDWVTRGTIEHKNHANDYPLVNNLATLTWLGQIAALEIHVPQWRFARTGEPKNPDRLVLDLDPGEGAGLPECAEVARLAREILRDMGLDPMPVTSGSKGIHLYAALDGKQTSDEVSAVAHELARALESAHPDLIVSDMKKHLRTGKVLVDWSQNNGSKTTITPYSLRGRSHPMVAAPRTWRELASPSLAQLDFHEVLRRVKRRGDPLADLVKGHLDALEPTADRLATYRQKRDASKTPEPVPSEAAAPTEGRSFVIQEHHARRLHYDFRLEHDGVLVSWALPKGVPTSGKQNHLAVQTEDHPLAYGSFEGTIPAGEYGGGEVTIWDAGTYELEKWRDGKEVIATLTGTKPSGLGEPRRFALIHTGGAGRAENNWLIHLMDPAQPAAPTASPTRAADPKRSASSGRPISPMLATLGTPATVIADDSPAGWAFEMKWDGIRAIARVRGGDVRLTSRNGNDLTRSFPELAEAVAESVGTATDCVLDGEIVALDARGRPDFGRLQTRMKLTKQSEIERAISSTRAHYFVFDALEQGDESLTSRGYDERRLLLEEIVAADTTSLVQVPPAYEGDLDEALAASAELRLEGVVAKKRDSTYRPAKRSSAWIKLKLHKTQEVVVVGWRPGAGRRANSIGSLLVAVPRDGELRYAGRVGTGFSERDLAELMTRFSRMKRTTSPATDVPAADARDAHWITPSQVGEVEFAEWTTTNRLRQPVWRGWRTDKKPADVVVEEPRPA